jgi:hypothetical protein
MEKEMTDHTKPRMIFTKVSNKMYDYIKCLAEEREGNVSQTIRYMIQDHMNNNTKKEVIR